MQQQTAGDVMNTDVFVVEESLPVGDLAALFADNEISGAPVVDEHGNLVGVLSEQDCMQIALNAGYYEEYGGHVEEYMAREVKTVEAEASIVELAEMFINAPYRRYPVLDDNRLVGQISRRDVLRALESLW